jgi:amino-acid N-acetyltransferase
MLIRKRAKQSEIAAHYVKAVGEEDRTFLVHNDSVGIDASLQNGKSLTGRHNATFHNGVGFDNGNGLWSGEQGFAIGGEERQSRLNGYLSELAAAAFVCKVNTCLLCFKSMMSAHSHFFFYHILILY